HTDAAGRIAVVHNGIIENAEPLRAALVNRGVTLVSDTDTEALAHMIAAEAVGEVSLEDAVRRVLRHVDGTYGLVVLDTQNPNELVVARNGSPIVLGIGASEMFVASDVAALVRYTKQVVYLDDAEVATVHASDYRVVSLEEGGHRTADGKVPTTVEADADDYELGPYADFMRKEIHEQPEALRRALRGRLDDRFSTAKLGGINLDARQLRSIRQVKFLGCGSAYYAGQMGAVLVEELARIPSDAEPASEFRYRNPVVDPDTLYVAVSQSGETLDTLMAVQELRRKGGQVIGAVNVVGSAIGRECGSGVFLHAGPEIAVASTKALTNMAASFAMLALLLGRVRDLSAASGQRMVAGLRALPGQLEA
ncbi:MAG: SIS domain-containing protein, partial [Streptosporangiaceae bacterium]